MLGIDTWKAVPPPLQSQQNHFLKKSKSIEKLCVCVWGRGGGGLHVTFSKLKLAKSRPRTTTISWRSLVCKNSIKHLDT
jgi:hypothetical protein